MFKYLNRSISMPIAIGIIVILIILVGGGTFIYQYYWPKTEPQPISFSNDCNELIRQVSNLVEEANYCNADSDCTISTETTKFCGCWSLINKNADLSKIKEGNEKYNKLNCPILMCAECMLTPQQEDIECVNHKCVVSSSGIVKLGDIVSNPSQYSNKTVIVEGKYGGWKPTADIPCNEANIAILTKSDTLIYDGTDCLFMSAIGGVNILSEPKNLNPVENSINIGQDIKVEAVVNLINGKPILGLINQ